MIEVFADITCPFTHVGLSMVADKLSRSEVETNLRVRSWPLEWVNGSSLKAGPVMAKAEILRSELGIEQFAGINPGAWPTTTIPALNLAAAANEIDVRVGLAVNLELRDALFERGQDISDPTVLRGIALAHDIPMTDREPSASVLGDYEDGKRRHVKGSPDFFAGDDEFFCPTLELGHDDSGQLTAQFDIAGLEDFISKTMVS